MKAMKTLYTKAVWTISVVAVLIGGYIVLAHPPIGRGLSPRGADSVETRMPTNTGRVLPTGPSSIQDVKLKDMLTQMLLRIKAARESRDMNELVKLGDEIEATWSNLDTGYYASLMLEVCNALSSTDLKDENQYVLEQKYALLVLGKQLGIPVAIEANLVLHLQEDIEYTKGQLNTEQWIERRRNNAEIWLRTWQHLNAAIDPNFDFKDLPWENVPLPPGISGSSGMAPDQIKDPTLRARYQSAIDANNKKAEAYRTQSALHRTRDTYRKVMEAYLIRSYSRPPDNTKELEAKMRKHLVDEETRERILNEGKENLRNSQP
jgi:hypothetical protein